VFINNIKELLNRSSNVNGGSSFNLQTLISTHSPHIVSESDFSDLKYLRREGGSVRALNLKDLEQLYEDKPSWFKFLKQYLTVHRSELFFADKAIFIEGDTERILVPAMITKVDQACEQEASNLDLPLQSQNVSIVEVGNHFNTFERFVRFIGIKCLVITDLDGGAKIPDLDGAGVQKENKDKTLKFKSSGCRIDEAKYTSNETLKKFFSLAKGVGPIQFDDLCQLSSENKTFSSDASNWVKNPDGNLRIAYQTEETNGQGEKYHARSFEDAFLHLNFDFLNDSCADADGNLVQDIQFPSLTKKHLKEFLDNPEPYQMAENGIGSKPSFAMEVLLNSKDETVTIPRDTKLGLPQRKKTILFKNWNSPHYISEGLMWLRKN